MAALDPVALTAALVRCPSITPEDAGAQAVLAEALEPLGFAVEHVPFGGEGRPVIANLFARLGTGGPHLAFAGHTDVVPPGDPSAWRADPFAARIEDGMLIGRGAVDMKSGIACFVAAVSRYLERHGPPPGSVSLLITGDEEGPAIDGTVRLLEWAAEKGHVFDGCVVGEPTNPERLGEMAKIGRRGSLTGKVEIEGVQGHVAYPHLADNAAHRLTRMMAALIEKPLDSGTAHFQPSALQITAMEVDHLGTNVVPAHARAMFNIRYNDSWDAAKLEAWLRERLDSVGGDYRLELNESARAFLCEPGPLSEALARAVEQVCGSRPAFSTSGGTSDARFISTYCPVVEFGAVGGTMHKVDERCALEDLEGLTRIYLALLESWFGVAGSHGRAA